MKNCNSFFLKLVVIVSFLACSNIVKANDSLRLGQSYINLSLTLEYLDSLDDERTKAILAFQKNELNAITDSTFKGKNGSLYEHSQSLWYYATTRYLSDNNTEPDRKSLLEWKKNLDQAINYSSLVRSYLVSSTFFDFIDYDKESIITHKYDLERKQSTFNKYYNRDIYPDFKRLFFNGIEDGEYHFDSLRYYSELYDFPFQLSILDQDRGYSGYFNFYYSRTELAFALDLISRFLQLQYIASGAMESVDTIDIYTEYYCLNKDVNPGYDYFGYNDGIIEKDKFFKNNINDRSLKRLHQQLQELYPYDNFHYGNSDGMANHVENRENVEFLQYYFPTPAPYPTDKIAVKNFRPDLKTLKEVDEHIQQSFHSAGYQGRLHYYYISTPGFAVATDIERINKDGSPFEGLKRWDLRANVQEQLSLYKIFKSMFFRQESDFRMIACIISSKEVRTSNERMSMHAMSQLIANSYDALPEDLEPVILDKKTITVLLYHFTQDDVGKVPILSQNTILTVYDHLRKTRNLTNLITN